MEERPNDEELRPTDEPQDNRPAEESPDFVANIRQEITQDEASRPALRPGLFQRVTGMLRRKKITTPLDQPTNSLPAGTEGDQSASDENPEPPRDLAAGLDGEDWAERSSPDAEAAWQPTGPNDHPNLAAADLRLQTDALRAMLMAEDDADFDPEEAPSTLLEATTPADEPEVDVSRAVFGAAPEPPDALSEMLYSGELPAIEANPMAGDAATAGAALDEEEAVLSAADNPPAFAPSEPTSPSSPDPANTRPLVFDDDGQPGISAPPAGRPERAPARTGGLRGLLTGILRPGENKKKELEAQQALDEKLVTNRLSRMMGGDAEAGSAGSTLLESGHEPMSLGTSSLDDGDEPNWDRLILAAGPVVVKPSEPKPTQYPGAPAKPVETSADPLENVRAEWEGTGVPQAVPLSIPELQPQPPAAILSDPVDADQAFWTGSSEQPASNTLPDGQDTIDTRLSKMSEIEHERVFWQGTGVTMAGQQSAAVVQNDELRTTLLEDYDENGPQISVERSPEAAPRKQPGVKQPLSRLERGLLVVLALLVVLLAAALSLLYFRPPPAVAAIITRPTGAPASGAMLPTGLELTGGWYFDLNRNTLEDGKWKPRAAEWLEGSELPRVVAIPWNPQTEAVIQTFEPGDTLRMVFGNNTDLTYKVREVKRVAVNDVSIFQNRRPSLVIVLFEEDAAERWVIICGK